MDSSAWLRGGARRMDHYRGRPAALDRISTTGQQLPAAMPNWSCLTQRSEVRHLHRANSRNSQHSEPLSCMRFRVTLASASVKSVMLTIPVVAVRDGGKRQM